MDENGNYQASGQALEHFSYIDPTESIPERTLWHPEDLPEKRLPDI
ncbi:MAG: hypothetical protein GY866_31500 [Proteobacteria bacterium]|nr:hypothetical protein [Pseudomonadota bacterium]